MHVRKSDLEVEFFIFFFAHMFRTKKSNISHKKFEFSDKGWIKYEFLTRHKLEFFNALPSYLPLRVSWSFSGVGEQFCWWEEQLCWLFLDLGFMLISTYLKRIRLLSPTYKWLLAPSFPIILSFSHDLYNSDDRIRTA